MHLSDKHWKDEMFSWASDVVSLSFLLSLHVLSFFSSSSMASDIFRVIFVLICLKIRQMTVEHG